MVSDKGGALMICASDDPLDRGGSQYQITFSVPAGRTVSAVDGNGNAAVEHLADGSYRVRIASNAGILIMVK